MTVELLDHLAELEAAASPAPWTPRSGSCATDDSDWRRDEWFLGWEIEPDNSTERRPFAKGADCHLVCLLRTHARELIAAARQIRAAHAEGLKALP